MKKKMGTVSRSTQTTFNSVYDIYFKSARVCLYIVKILYMIDFKPYKHIVKNYLNIYLDLKIHQKSNNENTSNIIHIYILVPYMFRRYALINGYNYNLNIHTLPIHKFTIYYRYLIRCILHF